MKRYQIITMLRPGIKDNPGTAVADALRTLGFPQVKNVRIGKLIEMEVADHEDIEKIVKEVYNEVMEDYTITEL